MGGGGAGGGDVGGGGMEGGSVGDGGGGYRFFSQNTPYANGSS